MPTPMPGLAVHEELLRRFPRSPKGRFEAHQEGLASSESGNLVMAAKVPSAVGVSERLVRRGAMGSLSARGARAPHW